MEGDNFSYITGGYWYLSKKKKLEAIEGKGDYCGFNLLRYFIFRYQGILWIRLWWMLLRPSDTLLLHSKFLTELQNWSCDCCIICVWLNCCKIDCINSPTPPKKKKKKIEVQLKPLPKVPKCYIDNWFYYRGKKKHRWVVMKHGYS